MHADHEQQDGEQIERKQGDIYMVCNKAEYGRHHAGSHIGRSHLYPDHRLGFILAEVFRGGMYDRRVDRGAAQPDEAKPQERSTAAERQE